MAYNVLSTRSTGKSLSIQVNAVNFNGVKVVAFGISGNRSDKNRSSGKGLVKVDRRQTSEGEISRCAGHVTKDSKTEVRVDQAGLVHGREERIVNFLFVAGRVGARSV